MRYLAVDYGTRRIGLAVSDETETFASPLSTRERKGMQHDIAAVMETMRGVGAQGIVMGLPRGLGHEQGQNEAAARKFASALHKGLRAAGLPDSIEWWDERFSTREALTHLRIAGISQRRSRDSSGTDSVDARAAAIILQGFLDARKNQGRHEDDSTLEAVNPAEFEAADLTINDTVGERGDWKEDWTRADWKKAN